ncbi:MAG: metalloendopeptidase [Candidatus Magnetoglobus multicellularis str. Araruama]|uniref:Metalloendopeptidase n=1 Tax=Candidatus Magnetoglobus multicellularis str. Araruama TaxID=890399 RepID=A0A1V1NTA5_9BACT|nr:MAG: metalloendopeptidase [Candidatus Magnetoglobus multicellularis str. Araruama]
MNKIHFIVFSSRGSKSCQFSLNKLLTFSASIGFLLLLFSLFYIVPDYSFLKAHYVKDTLLNQKLQNKTAELIAQRQQIKKFAQEINVLKQRVAYLNQFEMKVRTLANLDMPSKDSILSVGGTLPEDLDASQSLQETHSSLMRNMNDQAEQIQVATFCQEKSFIRLLDSLEERREILACTPSIRPTKGWYSSPFGYRVSPFTSRREFHKGVDIANHLGTKIVAAAKGLITFSGRKGGYGRMIVIDHGHGMETRYAHMNKLFKKDGDIVKRGDVIGTMGNTGRSTGPHLHYEVRLNGAPVNPTKYIVN